MLKCPCGRVVMVTDLHAIGCGLNYQSRWTDSAFHPFGYRLNEEQLVNSG